MMECGIAMSVHTMCALTVCSEAETGPRTNRESTTIRSDSCSQDNAGRVLGSNSM